MLIKIKNTKICVHRKRIQICSKSNVSCHSDTCLFCSKTVKSTLHRIYFKNFCFRSRAWCEKRLPLLVHQLFVDMSAVRTCPGLYCGRTQLADGSWDICGACPRGYRTNSSSYCMPCVDEPSLYDWQYLGFMVLLPLVLHWFFIDMGAAAKG